jgi:hypothetical protein
VRRSLFCIALGGPNALLKFKLLLRGVCVDHACGHRLWGAVGWGLCSLGVGACVDATSISIIWPLHVVGMVATLAAVLRMPVPRRPCVPVLAITFNMHARLWEITFNMHARLWEITFNMHARLWEITFNMHARLWEITFNMHARLWEITFNMHARLWEITFNMHARLWEITINMHARLWEITFNMHARLWEITFNMHARLWEA